MRIALLSLIALTVAGAADAQDSAASVQFKLEEVMVPVRDGVHLQTAILTPVSQSGPLPILFTRTPYGVPDKPPSKIPAAYKELVQDGYIFVFQNLRGRFKSEGVLSSPPTSISPTLPRPTRPPMPTTASSGW